MEDTSLLSDIAQVLVPERQPASLYELSIPICTTSHPKGRESQRHNTTRPPKERGQIRDHSGVKGDPTAHRQPTGTKPRKGQTRNIVHITRREPVDGTKRTHVRYNCDIRGSTKELSAESSKTHHLPSYQNGGSEPVSKTNCQSNSSAEIPHQPAAHDGYHLREHSHSCNLLPKPE